jgi:tetratricopeptide (TPR) repeat protein
MLNRRWVYAFAVLCLCLTTVAQENKPNDLTEQEGAVVEQMLKHVHYENDGTGTQQTTSSVRIQSDAGVQRYGQLVLGYSSATEKLTVDYVRVRKADGRVIETPEANQQDFAPEVLQSAPMYGDYRERHVTVVGLRPGDVLEYRTTTLMNTALAQGQFWFEYNFPKYEAVKEAKLEIEIPKARTVKLKSPKRKYEFADQGEWRTYTWVVRDIKPDRQDFDLNADDDDDDDDDFSEVQLTSFSDWKQVAEWYAKLQGERVSSDPAIKKKAAELTAGATTPTEKAHRLYDFVAKDFRYVSLSFGVGRYQPHAASEVLSAGYGDCKDKHTLLQALLRASGIESYPVLIGYGRKLDPEVPSPAQFNHVITAAKIGPEFTWLDATQEVAPYGHLLYELRNQQALLASADANAGLRKTPANSPVKSSLVYAMEGKVLENGAFDGTIDITASGDDDVPLRMTFRRMSKADWQRMAKLMSLNPNANVDVKDITVSDVNDTTKPLQIKFRFRQEKFFVVPASNSPFMPFPPMRVRRVPKKITNEPLQIGPIGQTIHRVKLQFPPNFTVRTPRQISLSRDYADYETSYDFTNNVLVAQQKLTMKMNELPPNRRNDYDSLRGVTTSIPFRTISLDARPGSGEVVAEVKLPETENASQLHRLGTAALDRRDFPFAAAALKKLVNDAPDTRDAWGELGRAYVGLEKHDDAIAAFRKQIELDKFHKRAYTDLATELQSRGKDDEAIAIYRQQLDNVPLDRIARKNLGMLLLKKHDNGALAELENAASVPPPDPEVNLALAQLYARSGKMDKARRLLVPIVGNSSPFPSGDIYAAALRDDIDPVATVRDARKILDDIGDQFDSGSYSDETIGASMQFVAIAWARIGWAKSLQGSTLEGLRFLNSAWVLSQSGAVANRMARIYDRAGQKSNAKHFYALATAAAGADAESSKAELQKADPVNADKLISQAQAEVTQLRTVKLVNSAKKGGTAEYLFIFDGSEKPDRLSYQSGSPDLHGEEKLLTDSSYPVLFPDVSSVKLVRRGTVICSATDCVVSLKPVAFDAELLNGF